MKEARLKQLYTILFHVYDTLEKCLGTENSLVAKYWGLGAGLTTKGRQRILGGDGTALYFECSGHTTICICQNQRIVH